MTKPRPVPKEDYLLLGPARSWSERHDVAVQVAASALDGFAVVLEDHRVVVCIRADPLDGVNRWRWLAAAMQDPDVVDGSSSAWRAAAKTWAPSRRSGTVRVLTRKRWEEMLAATK